MFDKAQPFGDNSIEKLVPIVKGMDVVTYSNILRYVATLALLSLADSCIAFLVFGFCFSGCMCN